MPNRLGVVAGARRRAATGAAGAAPTTPPIALSGADSALLSGGPSTAPNGAITVPAGDNSAMTPNFNASGFTQANKVFWFAPGVHTLGSGTFDQIQPGAGSTYVGAPGAIIDGQGVQRTAFGGAAANVTIKYLEIRNFVAQLDQITVNHDAAPGWTLQLLNIHNNGGAAIGCGSGQLIDRCWLHNNQQYGFNSFRPVSVDYANGSAINGVTFNLCEISYNGDHALEYNADGSPNGSGFTGAGKFWDTENMVVTNCWIHHSANVGIWADTNNLTMTCTGNLFEDNDGEAFFYEISWNFRLANNTFRRNAVFKGKNWASRGDNFPIPAVYISESGGDPNAGTLYQTSLIENNVFEDNWGDITLWESADRFCNSVGNTSGKIWKPRAASLAICNNPVAKTLTVTTTSGSTDFTVTGGTFESTDEGRPVSGVGIPAGAKIAEPVTNSVGQGFLSATAGRLTAPATASGSTTITLAAGSINTEPAFSNCRWRTQNITIQNNVHRHNQAAVLGTGYTLPNGVRTGKIALLSQSGTVPTWSPYKGDTIRNLICFSSSNVWKNNTYTGGYNWMPFDQAGNATYATWQSTYHQDVVGSTFSAG